MKNKKLTGRTVSMEFFLVNYVYPYIDTDLFKSVDGYEELREKIKNMNHYDADEFIDILKELRVGFKEITQEQINRGEVILVQSKGFKGRGMQVIAYRRPSIISGDKISSELLKDDDIFDNMVNINLPDAEQIRRNKRANKSRNRKKR